MLRGFWNEVVATELTEFYNDFVDGKRPKIVICHAAAAWQAVDRGRFHCWVSAVTPT